MSIESAAIDGQSAGDKFVEDLGKLTNDKNKEVCLAFCADKMLYVMIEAKISTNMMVKFLTIFSDLIKKSPGYTPEE